MSLSLNETEKNSHNSPCLLTVLHYYSAEMNHYLANKCSGLVTIISAIVSKLFPTIPSSDFCTTHIFNPLTPEMLLEMLEFSLIGVFLCFKICWNYRYGKSKNINTGAKDVKGLQISRLCFQNSPVLIRRTLAKRSG